MCKLVQYLPREKLIDVFLNRYTELFQDSVIQVRKTGASFFGEISAVVGTETTERVLLPHLIALSQDSVWGVRKACAECFTDVSRVCTMLTRRHYLAPVFLVLLNDSSKWVRSSAFQSLGPFISTFADSERTGLKWTDGDLQYDESCVQTLKSEEQEKPIALEPTRVQLPASSDDSQMDLGDFIDSGEGVEALNSNIFQLVHQRLCMAKSDREDECNVTSDIKLDKLTTEMKAPTSEGADLTSLGSRSSVFVCGQESSERHDMSNEVNCDRLAPFDAFSFWQPLKQEVSGLECFEETSSDKNDFAIISKYMEHLSVFRQAEQRGSERVHDIWWQTHASATECSHRSEETSGENVSRGNSAEGADPKAEQQDIIPQALLDSFLSMVEPTHVLSVEGDILRHCAFNIPAVAYTVGRKYWPILKPTYLELANDMQWKVRRTLAFSIHKLAAILGPEITEQDLLPVFVGFLRDLDEVRIGILQHLYDFMKLLNKNACRTLLGNLADFLQSDNVRDWRFRHLFAQQLIPLCVLYDIEDVNEYISPIAMTLAIDRVAEVRRITFRLVGMIFKCFYNAEKLAGKSFPITDNFSLDIVKSFAKSHRWSRRQTFVYICDEVMQQKSLAAEKFKGALFPALLELKADRIPNIRIAAAKVLRTNTDYFLHSTMSADFDAAMKVLANDCDQDVKSWAAVHSDDSYRGAEAL